MSIEDTERRDVHRILSAALEDPNAIPDRDLDRALELLASDADRVRISAAWVFGIVAAEKATRILPYVPQIAAHLEDPTTREEAARVLGYLAAATPEEIERKLTEMDETLARRCRAALWGRFAPRTVVETPTRETGDGAGAMGRTERDGWGWIGGGPTAVYDSQSTPDRRKAPTARPIDPPTVDYAFDRYTPADPIGRSETAASFKVAFRTPGERIVPGILKRFTPPEGERFEAAFDRRIRMWRSIDDHESILPVVDWGTDPAPWVVTAYEDVTGLAELREASGIEAAVWTLEGIAEALRFAHAHGVIHGGLTPGSIVRSSILTEPDAWRVPRVTDWGYVALLCEDGALPSVPTRYLAPEQRDPGSASIDGTTDVYGFGVLVYEALVGKGPKGGRDGEFEVSIPTALERRLPELEPFLRRCLAERKTERFETIEAAAAAFRTATGGVAIDD